jgi:hypothetical protein
LNGKKNDKEGKRMLAKIEDNPAMHREYVHLKRMVRNWENECNRRDPLPNAKGKLYEARAELREFKFKAQQLGYNI